MVKGATNKNTETKELSDQQLEAIAGGGHSRRENDDGSESGDVLTLEPRPSDSTFGGGFTGGVRIAVGDVYD